MSETQLLQDNANSNPSPWQSPLRKGTHLLVACLLGMGLTPGAMALDSDRKQPIEITADQAELDEAKGEAHYIGNVLLTQGSLIIRADNLTIKADDKNQIQRVTAKGKPAEFNQTPEAGKPPVVAKAKLIDYYVADEKLLLQLDAIVIQNDSTFQGNQIQYDIRNHRMQATSNGAKTGSSERVKMILPPSTAPDDNGTGTPGKDTPKTSGKTP